ncbi:Fc.00g002800.m01.CDS01 [Cosmosporella sp. VM-42]
MQSLWSRAGQAHRCGCRACETAINGLGRRASTAVRRRKPTFAEVFTACYSSVFATAAVVDAVRKEDRKQDLDRQLDEARRNLAELQQLRIAATSRSTASLDDKPAELTPDQMDELWGSLKDIYINRPNLREFDGAARLKINSFLVRLRDDYYGLGDKAAPSTLYWNNLKRLERAIHADEIDSRVVQRSPTTDRQLYQNWRTTVHLVTELLNRADANDKSRFPSPSFDEARQLAANDAQPYSFPSTDPGRAKQNTSVLNKRLRTVVKSEKLGLKEKVGRVCYNLLVSPYPPDMHTFNTLIVAFDKSGNSNLAESVVYNFFYRSRLRPSPSTFVAILNHYVRTNNYGRFLRSLACITGLDTETGAKMGRRLVQEIELGQVARSWKQPQRFRTQTGDKVWNHLPLTQPLIEAIIRGLLCFKQFDQAATFFVSCMKANAALSTDIIKQMFDGCIIAMDWRAAVRLVRGFANNASASRVIFDRDHGAAYLIKRFYALLDMCGLRTPGGIASESALRNLDVTGFDQLLITLDRISVKSQRYAADSTGSSYGFGDNDSAAASRSRVLQIASLGKEITRVGGEISEMQAFLHYRNWSPQVRALILTNFVEASLASSVSLNEEFNQVMTRLSEEKNREKTRKVYRLEPSAKQQPSLVVSRSVRQARITEERVKERQKGLFYPAWIDIMMERDQHIRGGARDTGRSTTGLRMEAR